MQPLYKETDILQINGNQERNGSTAKKRYNQVVALYHL